MQWVPPNSLYGSPPPGHVYLLLVTLEDNKGTVRTATIPNSRSIHLSWKHPYIKLQSWIAWKLAIVIHIIEKIINETKLKDYQLKLVHRIIVTKNELHRHGIKAEDKCLYWGKNDSIDHNFLNYRFVKIFVNNVMDWFIEANNSVFAPIKEKLFGIISGPYEKEILKKFNYAILYMEYY